MQRTARRTALLALSLAAVGLSAAPSFGQTAVPAGSRVGVVNVNNVRGKIKELADIKKDMEAQQRNIQSSRDGHEAQLKQLTTKIQNTKPENEVFNDLVVQLDEQKAKFQMDDQMMQNSLVRDLNKRQVDLYNKVMAATAKVAKQHGMDIVMAYNDVQVPVLSFDMQPEQLSNLLGQRLLMYVNDKVDLTDEVAAAMDLEYKTHPNGK